MDRTLLKLKIKLSDKLIRCSVRHPTRFILIEETLSYYHSLRDVAMKLGMTESSFLNHCDIENGIINDPVASMLFLNTKGIHIYEARLKSIIGEKRT